jgi:hypothetical protein
MTHLLLFMQSFSQPQGLSFGPQGPVRLNAIIRITPCSIGNTTGLGQRGRLWGS